MSAVLLASAILPLMGALAQEPPAFEQPLGWRWLLEPQPIAEVAKDGLWRGQEGDVEFEFDLSGDKVNATLKLRGNQVGADIDRAEYQVVVYDGNRRRFPLTLGGSNSNGKTTTVRRHLPRGELSPDRVAFAGIAMLTPEGRVERAREALQRAEKAKIEVIPLPRIGERLEFRLTTIDGKTVGSASLRGRVVLLDGWATWCSPCMAKMPKLKEIYAARRGQGFEIIGLNFDHKLKTARKAIEENGLTWPQVYVPKDEAVRTLWEEAASIEMLPRLILIDREGVVRADCGPYELEEAVAGLMADPEDRSQP